MGKYGLLMSQIVSDTKLVVPDRVRPVSHVGSGSILWVEVQAQARPSLWHGHGTVPRGHGPGIGAYQRHHRKTAMTPADANWGGSIS